MTTTKVEISVWIPNLKPLEYYHWVSADRTRCRMPVQGFGYAVPLRAARRNLCLPCEICFPPALFRGRL